MPTYEYRCGKCADLIEVYQSFSESPLTKHKGCGGKLTKVLSPAGIVLKGSGFYKNDARDSSKAKSRSSSEPKATEPAATKSDAPASGAKGDGPSKTSTSTSGTSGSSGSKGTAKTA